MEYLVTLFHYFNFIIIIIILLCVNQKTTLASVLSFHYGTRDGTCIIRLVWQVLNPRSHLCLFSSLVQRSFFYVLFQGCLLSVPLPDCNVSSTLLAAVVLCSFVGVHLKVILSEDWFQKSQCHSNALLFYS